MCGEMKAPGLAQERVVYISQESWKPARCRQAKCLGRKRTDSPSGINRSIRSPGETKQGADSRAGQDAD